MERKKFIGSSLLALVGVGLSSCNRSEQEATTIKNGLIIHSVYFWLKADLSEVEERDFLKYFDILRKIPGVQSLNYGKPAATTPRDVVDHSYSYNLILTFSDLSAITAYETHPTHVQGASEFSKYWLRVEVKDTLIIQ
ncbi:MAG: Dabb family protein [Sphingobacterium sp.]|jgi:hypothetical protein|nr:Dabb family protein [Sphingobacterium sp.]